MKDMARNVECVDYDAGACDNTVKLWDINKLIDDQDGEGITTANLWVSTSVVVADPGLVVVVTESLFNILKTS